MKRRAATLLAVGTVGALVLAGTLWWWSSSSRRPLHIAALPPRRSPTKGDKLLGALINVVNADMRSLELGRWYVRRLKAAVARMPYVDCATVADSIDYRAIARDVPEANDVTQREIRWLLRQLIDDATYKCPGRIVDTAHFLSALDTYDVLAFDREDGLLWGMPGYTVTSRLPLPE